MQITITGSPKEIAALALKMQGQQENIDIEPVLNGKQPAKHCTKYVLTGRDLGSVVRKSVLAAAHIEL